MKVIVASTNPVKIKATQDAFAAMFPEQTFETEGQNPGIDLPAQPMSDLDTKNCAIARMQAIHQKYTDADYWVAIEGGIEVFANGLIHAEQYHCIAWVVIQNKNNQWGEARTASFPIPHEVGRLIQSGVEMGHANDRVFGLDNSKHGLGMTGIVTDNAVNRTSYYTHAVTLALAPFKNADIYFALQQDAAS